MRLVWVKTANLERPASHRFWLPKPARFVPTRPMKGFPDRAKADADDIAKAREWAAAHLGKRDADHEG